MGENPKKILVISGSSRSCGATMRAVEALVEGQDNVQHIALHECAIAFYDYAAVYPDQGDDFAMICEKMLDATDIVFVTPVYWYAMSAPMKVFFDRLSDLLSVRKEQGRALKGKRVWLLTNGADIALPDGFIVPFELTSRYFDMQFMGHHYLYTHKDDALKQSSWSALQAFKKDIFQ